MTHVEPKLKDMRVMLVEDSFLMAASIARMLEDLGCHVVGPFAGVREALDSLETEGCDAGVLDINLGLETSELVAAELDNRGVPFVFVTGYLSPAVMNARFARFRRLHKPLTEAMLAHGLLKTLEGEN